MLKKGILLLMAIFLCIWMCGCGNEKAQEEEKENQIKRLSDKPPEQDIPSKVYSKDGVLLMEIDDLTDIDTGNYLVRCIIDALIRDSGKEMDGFPCIDSRMTSEEMNGIMVSFMDRLRKYGYTVQTSIDTKVMKLLYESLESGMSGSQDVLPDGSYAIEAGAFCCDRKNGKAVAYISGRNGKDVTSDGLKLYSYTRRPGSAIKPLVLYTPLLENGYTSNSYVIDRQYTDSVSNSDGNYEGKVTLEYAVAKSKNTVACEMLSLFGAEKGLDYLNRMNFDYLTEADATPFAAIGIFENGVTIPQMCSGFAAIASHGLYHVPTCVESITDSFGNTVYCDYESRIYSESSADSMNEILEKVFEYGTAAGLKVDDIEQAGKTGTTSGGLDGWMCGYSGDYVTVVWTGVTTTEYGSRVSLAGNGISGNIWKSFYESLRDGGYIKKSLNSDAESEERKAEDGSGTSDAEKNEIMIKNLIRGMNLKDKVYQLFITVPEQLGLKSEELLNGKIDEELKDKPVGGLIFFDRHIEDPVQVREMLSNMKAASVHYEGVPMFLAVDEEGGEVVRLAGRKGFGLNNIGSIHDLSSENEVYSKARYVGGYLSSYGFNLNFAPDVDLYYPDSILGNRTFSENSETVGRFAAAYIRGLNSEGIAGCYKHFPGIGSATNDMHEVNTDINKTVEEMKDDLFPFRTAAKIGADFVMVSHARLPQILDGDTVCSMSYDFVSGLLRQSMGYEGIVITDAMDMAAVTLNYKSDEAAVKAVLAGCDMILMPEDLELAAEGVITAVSEGILTEERIDESLFRIFKRKFNE